MGKRVRDATDSLKGTREPAADLVAAALGYENGDVRW
jgi:hypothetical protein